MPRSLFFVACDRAIIEEGTNNLSLISLISNIGIQAAEFPAAAAVPREWHIVTVIAAEPGDAAKQYEGRITMVMADGRQAVDSTNPLDLSQEWHRWIVRVSAFPINPAGIATLTLQIREAGGGAAWETKATYPIFVSHGPLPDTSDAAV
jgi:hypothetical protein